MQEEKNLAQIKAEEAFYRWKESQEWRQLHEDKEKTYKHTVHVLAFVMGFVVFCVCLYAGITSYLHFTNPIVDQTSYAVLDNGNGDVYNSNVSANIGK